MHTLTESLRGDFVVVNLGSGGDHDYDLAPKFRKALTLIEIDAQNDASMRAEYFARHGVNKFIAGERGKRVFKINGFPYCSSLHSVRKEMVEKYGLERYYEVKESLDVDCITLPEVLGSLDIKQVDFLKTDVEGEDFEIVKSLGEAITSCSAVQMELYIEPFFENSEPSFFDAANYLQSLSFDLVSMRQQNWKMRTKNWQEHKDGRLVWADCLFLKRLGETPEPLAVAKQIVILSMLGKRGFAEHLSEKFAPILPKEWKDEISQLTAPFGLERKLKQKLYYPLLGFFQRLTGKRKPSAFTFDHLAEF